MKKLIYVLGITFLSISCMNETSKDYMTLSGKITNQNSDSLLVYSGPYKKNIMVNTDGTFSDTLNVTTGSYRLFDGGEYANLYLMNGYELQITFNAEEFDETIKFTGSGAEVNNYLAKKALLQEKVLLDDDMFILEKPMFEVKSKEVKNDFGELLSKIQNVDTSFVSQQNKGNDRFMEYVSIRYEDKLYWRTVLAKGTESPKFVDYENFEGGKSSLDDFKGSYVYIDFWATWCRPCKVEIPYLKALEKEYNDKNIVFVSISTDRESAYETWKKMVTDKELTGVQLYSKRDPIFSGAYKVTTIPRFVLIDPDGYIVSSNAPKPSSGKLKELFDELKL